MAVFNVGPGGVSSVWDGSVGVTSRRNGRAPRQACTHMYTYTHFKGHTSSFPLAAIAAASPHESCGSLIPLLFNNCINYAAWNNMHYIFYPLTPCHLYLHPLFSPTLSMFCLCPVLFLMSYFLSSHLLCLLQCLTLFYSDFQSCLICVARRVPLKERPMLPAHESFTTRQDLQGTWTIQTFKKYILIQCEKAKTLKTF